MYFKCKLKNFQRAGHLRSPFYNHYDLSKAPTDATEKQHTCMDLASFVSAGLYVSMVTESGPITSL